MDTESGTPKDEKKTGQDGPSPTSTVMGHIMLTSTSKPEGWEWMSSEFALTTRDYESGLANFLYEARDLAANYVDNLFQKIGIDPKQYHYIHGVPIGLENESDVSGFYEPGIYAIVVGRESDDILDYANSDDAKIQKLRKRLAFTVAHEMMHLTRTVPLQSGLGFDTLDDVIDGWHGLGEGTAEAFAAIAGKMKTEGWDLPRAAQHLENHCAEYEAPLTQMSARMIRRMDSDTLAWYVRAPKTEEYKTSNKLKDAFGSSYEPFLDNMNKMLDYEEERYPASDEELMSLVSQTTEMIDKAFEQKGSVVDDRAEAKTG